MGFRWIAIYGGIFFGSISFAQTLATPTLYAQINSEFAPYKRLAERKFCGIVHSEDYADDAMLRLSDKAFNPLTQTRVLHHFDGRRVTLTTTIRNEELAGHSLTLDHPESAESPLPPSLREDASLTNRPLYRVIMDPNCRERIVMRWQWNDLGLPERFDIFADTQHVNTVVYNQAVFPLERVYAHETQERIAWRLEQARRTDRVLVTVMDSGVDYNHPDLADRISRSPFLGLDADEEDGLPFDNPNRMFPELGLGWHGTHVAGIIARDADEVSLLPIRVSYRDPKAWGNLVEYAHARGSRIVNVSMGNTDEANYRDLRTAIRKHPDMLFVVAAGNNGKDNDHVPVYPASYPEDNILSVASWNAEEGRLALNSNFGLYSVDVAAPGVDILSSIPLARRQKTSGTSMAAPYVTRIAARLKYRHPEWSPQQIILTIKNACRPVEALKQMIGCGGVLMDSEISE